MFPVPSSSSPSHCVLVYAFTRAFCPAVRVLLFDHDVSFCAAYFRHKLCAVDFFSCPSGESLSACFPETVVPLCLRRSLSIFCWSSKFFVLLLLFSVSCCKMTTQVPPDLTLLGPSFSPPLIILKERFLFVCVCMFYPANQSKLLSLSYPEWPVVGTRGGAGAVVPVVLFPNSRPSS